MSNLKFKHDVNSYEEASALYAGEPVLLAHNTWLDRGADDYMVIHHHTPIIRFHPDGSATIDAAWVSSTTANRLHHYKPTMVDRINRHRLRAEHYRGRYAVTLANHPGEFDIWEGERYRIFPDHTVVKV